MEKEEKGKMSSQVILAYSAASRQSLLTSVRENHAVDQDEVP